MTVLVRSVARSLSGVSFLLSPLLLGSRSAICLGLLTGVSLCMCCPLFCLVSEIDVTNDQALHGAAEERVNGRRRITIPERTAIPSRRRLRRPLRSSRRGRPSTSRVICTMKGCRF